MWRGEWVCVGDVADMPERRARGRRITVGGLPVLLVRDREGVLRAFLNVCRHRGAPLCEPATKGSGAALSCPYHAWLYRLDGSLARAQGVGDPDGFDVGRLLAEARSASPCGGAGCSCTPTRTAPPPDFGPLAAAIGAFPLEAMDVVLSETDERPFNWKVLLENYSENYHTPFVHPEIDNSQHARLPDGERRAGAVRVGPPAAARPTRRARMATLLPGEPGWDDDRRGADDDRRTTWAATSRCGRT